MNNDLHSFYDQVLKQALGGAYQFIESRTVGGGCINNGVVLVTPKVKVFLKWHAGDHVEMFEKEIRGLQMLREPGIITVPEPYHHGKINDRSYLLMEYVERAPRSPHYWSDFGSKLASLHQITDALFGLDHDNYIGRLPQSNKQRDSWVDFFITERLQPQLKRAKDQGLVDGDLLGQFDLLYNKLPDLMPDERPALLHGDLWSGNVMTGNDGQVSLIDPAVYYGHREMELAFTRLFGGFDREFYEQYEQENPLSPGIEERIDLYNLYPLLVHANLFGSSYLIQVKQILKQMV